MAYRNACAIYVVRLQCSMQGGVLDAPHAATCCKKRVREGCQGREDSSCAHKQSDTYDRGEEFTKPSGAKESV